MKTLTHLLHWQSFLQFFSLFFLLLYCSTSQAAEATFVWSPNSDANLAGYNIYYGVESGVYIAPVDVGNPEIINDSVTATLSSLEEGVTYYFAATAYDTDGFESDYSQEVVWMVPENSVNGTANTDFNADGMADILLRNSVGSIWLYEMNGNIIQETLRVGFVDLNWAIIGTKDFNGDGMADILMRNQSTGYMWLFEMDGNTILASNGVGGLNPSWDIAGLNDFNGDGKADILVRNSLGSIWLYEMNGNIIQETLRVGFVNPSWTIIGTKDFSADGISDILLQNQDSGDLWIYQMNSNNIIMGGSIGRLPLDWEVM